MSIPAQAFGVLGHPVAHSRSPAMHNAAFLQLGLPHRYFAFQVHPDGLADALAGAKALGIGGLNLTVPHKRAACALMDRLDPAAERIGAVNTVVMEGGKLVGHNTDGAGFLAALAELGGQPPRRVVVFGSGGAARAVVDALHHTAGLELAWVSRRPDALPPGPWKPTAWDELPEAAAGADLLVNATTVGMKGGPANFPVPPPLDTLADGARVIDLVYPRPLGGLLDQAAKAGLVGQDGLPTLLWQGVRALEEWMAQSLDVPVVEAMRAAIGSTLRPTVA